MTTQQAQDVVKAIHPKAKCYHTGTILGGTTKVYHVGVEDGDSINIIVPSHAWQGNRNAAWQKAAEYITAASQITGKTI